MPWKRVSHSRIARRNFNPSALSDRLSAFLSAISASSNRRPTINDGTLPLSISPSAITKLISSFSRAGQSSEALDILLSLESPNAYHYNTVINSLAASNRPHTALRLFFDMLRRGVAPTAASFTIMVKIRTFYLNDVDSAYRDLKLMSHFRVTPDAIFYSTLIAGFCRFGRIQEAHEVLDVMLERKCTHNINAYTSILRAYCMEGKIEEAKRLILAMEKVGCVLDTIIYSVLIEGLCRVGQFDEVEKVLVECDLKGWKPNEVTYNTYMNGLCKWGRVDEAFRQLKAMQSRGLFPDIVTLGILFDCLCHDDSKICAAKGLLERSFELGWDVDVCIYNTLMSRLYKIGDWPSVLKLLMDMVKKGIHPDTCTFTVVIRSLCLGMVNEARCMFSMMNEQNIVPNEFTYGGFMPELLTRVICWLVKGGKLGALLTVLSLQLATLHMHRGFNHRTDLFSSRQVTPTGDSKDGHSCTEQAQHVARRGGFYHRASSTCRTPINREPITTLCEWGLEPEITRLTQGRALKWINTFFFDDSQGRQYHFLEHLIHFFLKRETKIHTKYHFVENSIKNANQRAAMFIGKGYGMYGIIAAVTVGLILPLVLSSIFIGKRKNKQRAVAIEVGGETGITMRNSRFPALVEVPWEGAITMAALFEQSCKKHAKHHCLGTRKLIKKEVVESSDGRKFEKLHLGEYQWLTYGAAFERACNFASGLVKLGHNVEDRAAIVSDTRAEWLLAFQGCFRQNITVVTIYASLGEEALVHSLNETEVSTLICDSKQLKRLSGISSQLETIKHVVYFEDEGQAGSVSSISDWTILSFNEVEKLGKENPVNPRLPSRTDIAVIMYTSGSTGLPKGVMITHGNIVATAAAVMTIIPGIGQDDVYLAYLPLAHVLELAAESVMLSAGSAIGYGSALTLTDTSNKIKEGTKGDASVLKPTLMAAVPAILDRIRDGVLKKVEKQGGVSKKLFNVGYKRRLSAIEGSWFGAWGLERIIWENIVFKRIRSILGGKIRFVLCGGAPLSKDTQRFTNICLGAPVGQGYGLTETCAGAAFSEANDTSVGRVGPPIPSCYIKLVSWDEGGYTTSDAPMPRGEIIIGGHSVTLGYFKNEAKTKEVYKVDENGVQWFYTGDIGQFHPDGCLEIIDRKKDIVKLQHGEYISLGKAEAAFAASNYIDNIMVYADPFHSYCVALVVPSRQALENWAQSVGIEYKNFQELCTQDDAVKEVQQSLLKAAKAAKLDKFEIPAKIMLLPDPWTVESGLVTAALKLKREQLKAKFKAELDKLYN
ncbi:hypothetical protein J5N97_006569 [Dioscorea zingiberensis]|uniref:4-coumarate--CoA ligase n=1 Tax=Dioscorea zingiberensis TaxID=325984 RepID=A0A9D5DAD8_9LILI|nr:hypothetical protein J5N97_006569 [Dioscorea zingiberensis]